MTKNVTVVVINQKTEPITPRRPKYFYIYIRAINKSSALNEIEFKVQVNRRNKTVKVRFGFRQLIQSSIFCSLNFVHSFE